MRMWMISPDKLCKQHLLGEHNELHKHKSSFDRRHSMAGRVSPIVLIEPTAMFSRHAALVSEMLKRGYKHNSPYIMPDISYLPYSVRCAKVNLQKSIFDLRCRCRKCRV